jgi:(1->4)-alpha-D-glucan 1-alpha-D-glucosylmutase
MNPPLPRPAALAHASAGAVIPRATYRLQLHRDFGFDAAAALLPYLARLGISHVYCSPITRARPGSLHGYDVTDHAQINPELGGVEGFDRFGALARSHGIGLLLDQVPNHMGVFGADNIWWMDVLESGEASEFAPFFDIDWHPPNPVLDAKLLLPVLGDSYGAVLERDELVVAFEPEPVALVLRYHEHRFALDPRTWAPLLLAASRVAALPAAAAALRDLADACVSLPARSAAVAPQRKQALAALRQHFARAGAEQPPLAIAIAAAVEAVNREPDRTSIDALHDAQAYRLAHWRMAADEINYRRFFDINELAALRVEDERVFEAVQGAALDLAAAGQVDGLRIDHPDGLRDPAQYFERLQQGFARRCGAAANAGDGARPARPLYVVAEKIAAAHEEVSPQWAVYGTTGYRFATVVNGLFVERRSAARFERIWRDFSGVASDFDDIACECKRSVARGALGAQLTTLAHALQLVAHADRRTRDYGLQTLRDAIAEVAAAMPAYRTYVDAVPSAQDRRFIEWAIAHARKRSDVLDPALYDFVRTCLLIEPPAHAAAGIAAAMRHFAHAFQQFCAPVAAKGIEDTAFYRYGRLVSLNEVGGDPRAFGLSAAAFHGASAERSRQWPHTMLATSTHDNKRAEDVRCRIDVLSEQPAAWRLALRRWKTATRTWRTELDGDEAPTPADQYLLHQTLLGTLPPGGLTEASLDAYRQRIDAYMRKAAREAKTHTRWDRPDAPYEAALSQFVRGLLGRVEGNPVLDELQARATQMAWFGALNSLAMTALKYTSPGVPDLYQGTELIDLSLVDPDNRRPVDHAARASMLTRLEALASLPDAPHRLRELAASATDGQLKLWLIWRLLALRREQPMLFSAGDYRGLRVRGVRRRHLIAFVRRAPGHALLVVVARKFVGLGLPAGQVPSGPVWAGTHFALPAWLEGVRGYDVLTLRGFNAASGTIDLGDVLPTLPFAAIHFRT